MSAQLQVLQLPRDINRFCRACMTTTENDIICFDNYILRDNEQTELCRMFESVTSLNVSLEDGLPETICQRCTEQIAALYMFRSQCQHVDKQLQSLRTLTDLSPVKIKSSDGSTCSEPKLDISENYQCKVCHGVFPSYYSFSMHMIEHDRSKNLFERFVDNLHKEKIVLNHTQPSNTEINISSLVKARKLSIHRNSALNTINDEDCLKEENEHDDNVDIKPENSKIIMCRRQLNTSRRNPQKRLNHLMDICCKICSKQFNSRKELISHMCTPVMNHNADINNTGTICTLCEKSFPNPSILSLHFLKHAHSSLNMLETNMETDMIFCEICGQICYQKLDLQLHYKEKHGGKPSELCIKCCQTFDTKSALLEHECLLIQDVTGNSSEKENTSCVLCNTTFTSKEILLQHSVEHLMKKYTCKKCLLSFCTRNSYFSHLTTHAPYRYSCATCGKSLSTKSALKSHIVGVHSNKLNHTCSTCGKSFTTPSRLKIHSQIHKNHKKYVCSYCGYSTHKAGDLQMHVRIHTSERPYKCTFANCNASFKTSSHLCEHVRRHLQIKRFKCSVCGSSFTSSNGLKIHHMQHTGEKPYSCAICNLKFRRKYHVKVHMKQHEPK